MIHLKMIGIDWQTQMNMIQFFSKYEDINTQNVFEKNRMIIYMIPFKINIFCFTNKSDFQQVMTLHLNKFTSVCIGDKPKNKNKYNSSKRKKSVGARELQMYAMIQLNQMPSMIENSDSMEQMEETEDEMHERERDRRDSDEDRQGGAAPRGRSGPQQNRMNQTNGDPYNHANASADDTYDE